MLKLRKIDLHGYAVSFVSFALPRINQPVKDVIMFGSVARGDFDEKSDLDLFFSVPNPKAEKDIEESMKIILKKFYNSKIFESWRKKGVGLEIKTHVGVLEKWELRSSVLAEGICLYGKYKEEIPSNAYVMLYFDPIKNITRRNRVVRSLFGREERKFARTGLVEKLGGKKIAPTSFIVPIQFCNEASRILIKEKVPFKIIEFWSSHV